MNREALLVFSKDDLIALVLAQHAQIAPPLARVAAVEVKLATPPKTPDNSSLPPSKGQKPNLPDRPKKGRHGRPGVGRALAEHPDRIIVVTLPACPLEPRPSHGHAALA